ncbi:MAG: F0F1 ATP synthase subunit B [Nocardioidaceae bacterium]
MPERNLAASNFLVPNATLIVELIAFLIILGVLAKWVIPPISKAMTERQEKIKRQFDELEQAKADAKAAEEKYLSQLVEARHEAARIREQAREEGAMIISEMRGQAQEESQRIIKNAHNQVEADRQQVIQQLRTQMGSMATALAGRIVGESLDDDDRRSRTVERFVASLEQGEPSEVF